MKSETYTLPTDWCAYLVNNDASGLSKWDKRMADQFLKQYKLTDTLVDMSDEDPAFARPDCAGMLPALCSEYTFNHV